MLRSSFFAILFTINVIIAKPLYNSLADVSELLEKHPRSPLIIIAKTNSKYNQNILRAEDEKLQQNNSSIQEHQQFHVVEIEKDSPRQKFGRIHEIQRDRVHRPIKGNIEVRKEKDINIKKESKHSKVKEAERAIGILLRTLQIKNPAILNKLREKLALLKNKYRHSLRTRCSPIDSSCDDDEPAKEYHQKSNKEVFEYLKNQQNSEIIHHRSHSIQKRKKAKKSIKQISYDDEDNISTRGPDSYKDNCFSKGGSTKAGHQWDKPAKDDRDKCVTKSPKLSGSTRGYRDPGSHKDNCIDTVGSTKAGPQWDETKEQLSDECVTKSKHSGSTRGPKCYQND